MRKKHEIPEDYTPPEWTKNQIFDEPTGALLKPGEPELCQGNGKTVNVDGDLIECCCDECDYLQQCFPEYAEVH